MRPRSHFYKSMAFIFAAISFVAIMPFSCLSQTNSPDLKGYGKARYSATDAGVFMRNWLVAGPFPVSANTATPNPIEQEKAFKTDNVSQLSISEKAPPPPLSVKQVEGKWQLVSATDDIVDLDAIFKGKDFVYGYALAEITASSASNVLLGLGSDDGVKVWLNGKLVHDNWMPRGIQKDNDLVPLQLIKGSNQILLKIQDMQGGWGFAARILDKAALTKKLNTTVGTGNIDQINTLINAGADLNGSKDAGLTPLMIAKITGREDVSDLLLKKGALDKPVPSGEKLTDEFYNSLKGKEAPGVAILVAKDGKVLYKKGFGYADVRNKVPFTPETKFRIGSVTKQFTAAAILKLQENNLLSVNDKLTKFIPDFPRGDEVTIHHLLTHTSGIHSYTNNSDFIDKVTKPISTDSLISAIKKDPYDFNPGERMLYNNSGYFMLGYIIGKVSGKPYDVYLKETFFDPLGMKNTGVYHSGIRLDNEAKGHAKNNDKYEYAINWDMSWAGAAGALYSTVDDLLKWNDALYGGKVLTKSSLDAALTPAVLKNGGKADMQYGYGLMKSKYRGLEVIGHSGGLHGFITQLSYYPAEKLTVAMFSNTMQPEVNFDPMKVAESFLWQKMDKQASYVQTSVKPANLQIYTGRYDLMGRAIITVTAEDNKLFAQLSGQPKFEIFPSSEDEFFWKVVEARIKFFKNDKGEVHEAILYQNGQEMKSPRLPEQKFVQVPVDILKTYTGKYKLNEKIIVTLTLENDKLFATPTDQPKSELRAVTATEFVISELNANISFVKDETGKISKFKLNMNGMNTDLPKIE